MDAMYDFINEIQDYLSPEYKKTYQRNQNAQSGLSPTSAKEIRLQQNLQPESGKTFSVHQGQSLNIPTMGETDPNKSAITYPHPISDYINDYSIPISQMIINAALNQGELRDKIDRAYTDKRTQRILNDSTYNTPFRPLGIKPRY